MSVFVVVVDDFQIHANSGEQVVYANVEVVFDCSAAAAAGCRLTGGGGRLACCFGLVAR